MSNIPFINNEVYNPEASALALKAVSRWGKREERRHNLVKYGIPDLDLALSGINTEDGELNIVQGFHKHRKTTFMINVMCNIMTDPSVENKPGIAVFTLESGMSPNRYIDQILCVLATRFLLQHNHTHDEYCMVCGAPQCRALGLTPEFLALMELNRYQKEAIEWSINEVLKKNRLFIFGANPVEGDSRSLRSTLQLVDYMVKSDGVKIVVADHAQQYDEGETSYDKLEKVIDGYGTMVAKYNFAAFILSQVSLTSWREAKQGTGSTTATGGNRGAQEAVSVLETSYQSGDDKMVIAIKESRKAESLQVQVPIEKKSGCFIPKK